jgi:hypothetical protein
MPEETVLYTTNEIQRLFEDLAIPDGEQANEIEVSTELTVKVTFILYQSIDDETGKSVRTFQARLYHDDCNESEPVFPSVNYAAEIQDVNGGDINREIDFDEITGLLQINPDKALWQLEIEPD